MTMKLTALVAAIGFVMSSGAWAADTGVHTFYYEVQENSQIALSGTPGALTIVPAAPGAPPATVTDSGSFYSIVNNAGDDSKQITAEIDVATPAGVTLSVTLVAPTGATATKQALTADPKAVVVAIDSVSEGPLGITYELTATAAAEGMVDATLVEVTYTITDA